MGQEGEPNDGGAEDGAEHLAGQVVRHERPVELPDAGEAECDSGIDMRSGEIDYGVNGDGDSNPPAGGYDYPAGIVAGGFLQGHICIYAAPKQDKQEGPDQFRGEFVHGPECTGQTDYEKESLVTVWLRAVRAQLNFTFSLFKLAFDEFGLFLRKIFESGLWEIAQYVVDVKIACSRLVFL